MSDELMQRLQAFLKVGGRLPFRRCSICDAWLYYVYSAVDDGLTFESSCDCTSSHTTPRRASWDELFEYYREGDEI